MSNDGMMVAWIESDDGALDLASWPGGESAYHTALRGALAPEYRNLPTEEIDELVGRMLAWMPAADAEGFGSFLKSVGRAVAPIAAAVIPAAAPIVGTMIGGPAGAAIGTKVGQIAGGMLGGRGVVPPVPVAPAPVVAPAPAVTPAPAVMTMTAPPAPAPTPVAAPAPVANGATSAAGQLVALLQNPALLKSLAGQLLGAAGTRTVPVGPDAVPAPFAAFMNALSTLANEAASEAAEQFGEAAEAESTAYLRDGAGNFLYDPAVPEERAAALLAQLRAGDALAAEAAYAPFGESWDGEAWDGESWDGDASEGVGDWLARAGLVR